MILPRLAHIANGSKLGIKKYSSALYITGDKAHNNFVVLTPYIDIVERFENKPLLEANIKARGKHVDLDGICNRWAFYQDLVEKRMIIEATRKEIHNELSRLLKEKNAELNTEVINKLKAHANIMKDEYSTLKNFMYGVEESAALKALSLPNILHNRTPVDNPKVILEHLPCPKTNDIDDFPSHISIGSKQDLLEIHDNTFAFLINDAALFEQAVLNYFHEKLSQTKMIQFSNTDFAKSIIVEGCGSDFTKNDIITLEYGGDHLINRLHLTGGASHFAFMAHFTKYSIPMNQFPLKYFALGRKYQATTKDNEASLFNLVQQSAIEIFTATNNTNDMDVSLDEVTKTVEDIYKGLGYHFRLSIVKASQLKDYESLRIAIEMYSNHFKNYIEIGNISVLDDYVSKRLLFTYTDNKERKFPKVIVGNILNVQKMLGCILENNWEHERLSNVISKELMPYVP